MTEAPTIGILSLGELGEMFCRSLRRRRYRVLTFVENRSAATRRRALDAGAELADSLRALVGGCDVVISLVPPASAVALAEEIAGALREVEGTKIVVDANSIAPRTAADIARMVDGAGGRFVDGSVMTLPRSREPRMYVSGEHASELLALDAPDFRVLSLGEEIGRASRLKMSFSFITKNTIAVWMAMLAIAEASGVREELVGELEMSDEPLSQASIWKRIARISEQNLACRKAPRWEGEVREAQSALEDFGMGDLATGARQVFHALAEIETSGRYPGQGDFERLARALKSRE